MNRIFRYRVKGKKLLLKTLVNMDRYYFYHICFYIFSSNIIVIEIIELFQIRFQIKFK
jgi:hypothetical protein